MTSASLEIIASLETLSHLKLNFKQRFIVKDIKFEKWGNITQGISLDISSFKPEHIRSLEAFRPIMRGQKYFMNCKKKIVFDL